MKSTLKVEEKFGHRKSFVILKPNFFNPCSSGIRGIITVFSNFWKKILRVRVVSKNKAPHPLLQLICSDWLI